MPLRSPIRAITGSYAALLLSALLAGGAQAQDVPASGAMAPAQPLPDVPGTPTEPVTRDELRRLQSALDEAHAELDRMRQANQGLAAEAATLRDELARLRASLNGRGTSEAELKQHLDLLRARLPAPEGGSLTAADARKAAETDAQTLKHLIQDGRGVDNPQLWQRLREAENALHRSQYLLARADNARTVYRVRPGDTLAQISWLFYGDGDQWTRIFDANRHVIDTPGALPPGLTVVIP
jgi:nucleoid-associated protein YgaU